MTEYTRTQTHTHKQRLYISSVILIICDLRVIRLNSLVSGKAVWILTLRTHTETDRAPLLWSLEHILSECECVWGAYHVCVVTSKRAPLKMHFSACLRLIMADDITETILTASKLWRGASYIVRFCVQNLIYPFSNKS